MSGCGEWLWWWRGCTVRACARACVIHIKVQRVCVRTRVCALHIECVCACVCVRMRACTLHMCLRTCILACAAMVSALSHEVDGRQPSVVRPHSRFDSSCTLLFTSKKNKAPQGRGGMLRLMGGAGALEGGDGAGSEGGGGKAKEGCAGTLCEAATAIARKPLTLWGARGCSGHDAACGARTCGRKPPPSIGCARTHMSCSHSVGGARPSRAVAHTCRLCPGGGGAGERANMCGCEWGDAPRRGGGVVEQGAACSMTWTVAAEGWCGR